MMASANRPPPAHKKPAVYSGYVDWLQSTCLLAANTDWYPNPKDYDRTACPFILVDGLWGRLEWTRNPSDYDPRAPWLLYLPVSDELLCDVVHKGMWKEKLVDERQYQNRWTLREDLRLAHRKCYDQLKSRVEAFCVYIQKNNGHPLLKRVQHTSLPRFAIDRALNAYGTLVSGVPSWESFVITLRALQRALLEMSAFVSWAEDLSAIFKGEIQVPRKPTRGAIFSFSEDHIFHVYATRGVAVYLIIDKRTLNLSEDYKREPSRPRCLLDGGVFVASDNTRSLAPWYYPPSKAVKGTERLYWERDVRGDRHDGSPEDKKRKAGNDTVVGVPKKKKKKFKAKDLPNFNDEARRLLDGKAKPSWVLQEVPCYTAAFNDNLNTCMPKEKTLRSWFFPPVHLLWGASTPERESEYFQRLVQIWPTLLRRVTLARTDDAICPLSTGEWRDYLGDSGYKKAWPSRPPNGDGLLYDRDIFYKFGACKVWGQELTSLAGPETECKVIAKLLGLGALECGCPVTPQHFDDDLRYSVVFRVVEYSLLVALSGMMPGGTVPLPLHVGHKHAQNGPLNFEDFQDQGHVTLGPIMDLVKRVVIYNGKDGRRGWEEESVEQRRGWVAALRDVLSQTELFAEYDGFKVEGLSGEDLVDLDFDRIETLDELRKYEHPLISFYVYYFLKAVGELPYPFLPSPKTYKWTCRLHRPHTPTGI